jgi:hypothetical protein
MFVTTSERTNEKMIDKAIAIANELHTRYVHRRKQTVKALQMAEDDDCIVVEKNRLTLYPNGESKPFFFHPNSAMFRIKRLLKGGHDPFLDAVGIEKGMSLLDCTLGLAADSIIASFAVGETGQVVGTEANPYIYYIVKDGLKRWDSGLNVMNDAMRRIQAIHSHCYDFLRRQPDNRFDCVYFDPMFEKPVLESDGIQALSRLAIYDGLSEQLISEALRVARKRVVLKDHFRSTRFEKFGFRAIRRQSAKFHFGILEK